MRRVRSALIVFFSVGLLAAQNSSADPDGLSLLQQMSQHYAGAKSWYLEATREETQIQEYSRNWSKTIMLAAVSGDKYHYEGRASMGSAIHISDGKTEWTLHSEEQTYTQQAGSTSEKKLWGPDEMAVMQAEQLRETLAGFADHYTGAARLPDETLSVGGAEILCYVVRVTPEQRKGPRSERNSREETLWIDKATLTVKKIVEHTKGRFYVGNAPVSYTGEAITTYTTAQLNTPVPDSLFQFVPPADAKLVPTFGPMNFGLSAMAGQPAPDVQLVGPGSKRVPLSSYRGKPVLIDFWATWCAPCVKGLPGLAKLAQEAAPKGLVLLTVDEDQEEKTATNFLAKNHFTWPNTHDDGKLSDAFRVNGFPVAVLINAEGKIVFDRSYGDEATVREAVAGLGPEFASLAPAPKSQPCQIAAKSQ